MIGIVSRGLTARWPSFVGSLSALTLGVALAAAAGLALVSAVTGPDEPPHWYVTPDVVVAGPNKAGASAANPNGASGNSALPPGERGHIPAETVTTLATMDGIRQVVVDRAGYARLDQATEAHPWSAAALHSYTLVAGGPPNGDDQVVLTAPTRHRPGDHLSVTTFDGPRPFTVSGVIRTDAPAVLYVTDDTAARLANNKVAAVALFAVSGTDTANLADRVRTALVGQPGLRVLTGDARRLGEPDPDAGLLVATASLLGDTAAMAVSVTIFVVAATFAFTVALRRREFALLRAAGATPGQIRRLVLSEALAIAGLGGLAGCALATVIAPPFAHWLAHVGLAPADFSARIQLWPLAAACGLGLLTATAGAWLAARRAGATRPIEALRETSNKPRTMPLSRCLFAAASLAGAAALAPLIRTPVGAAYLLIVAMLLTLGGALLAPAVVRPMVRTLGVAARGLVWLLARQSALAAARRTAATAAPVLVTVGLAGATLAGTATLSAAQAHSVRDHITAPLVLTPAAGAALTDTTTAEATRVPGIIAAVPVKHSIAYDHTATGVQQHATWCLDGPQALDVMRLPIAAGSMASLTGDTVALSTLVADTHGWTVGSTAQLWLSDGALVALRVVAVTEDRLGMPAVLLPWAQAKAHSTTPVPDAVYLATAPDADPSTVEASFDSDSAQVLPTDAYLTTLDAEFDRLNRLALLAIIGTALLYTAISTANTQLMATTARAGEFAALKLAGATPAQVRAIVAGEALLVATIGIILGAAITGSTLVAVHTALRPIVTEPPTVIPWQLLLTIAASCGLLTLLASIAPTVTRRPSGRWAEIPTT
jgi:putative ABC transport system permease protein